jgi:hypothetical protein
MLYSSRSVNKYLNRLTCITVGQPRSRNKLLGKGKTSRRGDSRVSGPWLATFPLKILKTFGDRTRASGDVVLAKFERSVWGKGIEKQVWGWGERELRKKRISPERESHRDRTCSARWVPILITLSAITPTASANCTGAQIAIRVGGDPSSIPPASRPALRGFEGAP